ncbi:MAG: DegT/DnrJ/EryC1/StrS family aminotransferase [Deltaproteobacteria bacterium]|nr:DegT/DnrJ/EryC1/StrS family aminotransferase [Deltaproteobacteria bacterium]
MTVQIPIIRPTLPPFDEVEGALREVWASGMLTVGQNGRDLEAEFAARCDAPHAVSMSSCTSGLILLVQAMNLPEGGEVIVPAFTFAATAHAVVWNRLTPVFADCKRSDLTLDVESTRNRMTENTVAIMATTIFGVPPDMDELIALAEEAGIPLILDSAQALGSTYKGKTMGSFGVGEVFSMSPTKVATACEAGVITTRDPELAARLKRSRDYGKAPDGQDMEFVGLSARLSEFHAIVARATLRHLDEYIAHRLAGIEEYKKRLDGLPGISFVGPGPDRTTSCNYMVIRVGAGAAMPRNDLYGALAERGIQTKKYFFPALHQQTAFAPMHDGASLPEAESAAAECLAVPLYGHISEETIDTVCQAIRDILGANP